MSEESSYAYDESLRVTFEDLSARFFLNLPEEEFSQWERVFYQLEQAHWFYEDFLREENELLPKLKLRDFCKFCFEFCPVLRPNQIRFEELFVKFQEYLFSVPVCGALLLNHSQSKCLLVKGWGSKSWGFPKGKINQGELEVDCAIRETSEEVGYDISGTIDDSFYVQGHGKEMKLFIIVNVDENYPFSTKTRKEISEIKWFEIDSILQEKNAKGRAKFWNARPFLKLLKKVLRKNDYGSNARRASSAEKNAKPEVSKRKNRRRTGTRDGAQSGTESVREINDPFAGEQKGWSVEEMFRVNEMQFGVKATSLSDVDELAGSMAKSGYHYKDLRAEASLSNSGSSAFGNSWLKVGTVGLRSAPAWDADTSDAGSPEDHDCEEFQFDMESVMGALNGALKI